jgi:hypothetical protein
MEHTLPLAYPFSLLGLDLYHDPMGEYGYFLTLPIAAPSLGQYSTTLPITLTEQSAVAGKYSVEASATGYTNQSVNLDISEGSATQNFTLTP